MHSYDVPNKSETKRSLQFIYSVRVKKGGNYLVVVVLQMTFHL